MCFGQFETLRSTNACVVPMLHAVQACASSHMLEIRENVSEECDRLKNNWKFPREKGKFLNSIGKHCDFLASPLPFP